MNILCKFEALHRTLKAFANSSPGLRLVNPGSSCRKKIHRNPEGVARRSLNRNAVATPSELLR